MIRNNDLETEKRLVKTVPSERQIVHQRREFYAFVHFTVNTYTGKEWGDGTEPESIFNPVNFSADQWVESVMSAGMKGIILTCKHHDGFCLWPSRYTEHSVKNSHYQEGKGDIVREVSEACKKAGIGFGVYLSPWDRNNEAYGQGKAYDDYFIHQLEELLGGYGEIFSVWFDGACGEGPNGKVQYYDWERYYETIRRLQPNACIHVCGPDVRWCGNEAGKTRESEWSVVPERTKDTEKIAEKSQQADETEFREREIHAQDWDLGSYGIVSNEPNLIWYPAEVNTSIRPGWFYHPEEDDKVRPVEELFDIYEKSVGGNGTFLLNIPPTPSGLFHQNDVERLRELGEKIRSVYGRNFLCDAKITASTDDGIHRIENVQEDHYNTWFQTKDGVRAVRIDIQFTDVKTISRLILMENIRLSQRIEGFRVSAVEKGQSVCFYEGTIVGYKKMVLPVREIHTDHLVIEITDSRVCPTLSFIGVY